MGVTIEGYGRILMPEDLGERLDVHAALDGAGGKGMTQGMKALMRDM